MKDFENCRLYHYESSPIDEFCDFVSLWGLNEYLHKKIAIAKDKDTEELLKREIQWLIVRSLTSTTLSPSEFRMPDLFFHIRKEHGYKDLAYYPSLAFKEDNNGTTHLYTFQVVESHNLKIYDVPHEHGCDWELSYRDNEN